MSWSWFRCVVLLQLAEQAVEFLPQPLPPPLLYPEVVCLFATPAEVVRQDRWVDGPDVPLDLVLEFAASRRRLRLHPESDVLDDRVAVVAVTAAVAAAAVVAVAVVVAAVVVVVVAAAAVVAVVLAVVEPDRGFVQEELELVLGVPPLECHLLRRALSFYRS